MGVQATPLPPGAMNLLHVACFCVSMLHIRPDQIFPNSIGSFLQKLNNSLFTCSKVLHVHAHKVLKKEACVVYVIMHACIYHWSKGTTSLFFFFYSERFSKLTLIYIVHVYVLPLVSLLPKNWSVRQLHYEKLPLCVQFLSNNR